MCVKRICYISLNLLSLVYIIGWWFVYTNYKLLYIYNYNHPTEFAFIAVHSKCSDLQQFLGNSSFYMTIDITSYYFYCSFFLVKPVLCD